MVNLPFLGDVGGKAEAHGGNSHGNNHEAPHIVAGDPNPPIMPGAIIRVPFSTAGDKLPVLEILYKDIFIPKALYWIMREWFMERGYKDLTDDDQLLWVERLYAERRLNTRDYRMWWRLKRSPFYAPANSTFYQWFIDIDMRGVGVTDIEVMHEGKKIRAFAGEMRFQISARIEWDPKGEWKKHWLLRSIEQFFRRRMFKSELESSRKQLWRDVYRFHGMLKKYLELKTFVPEFETFHEKYEVT